MKYDDIINLPHHRSSKHPHMPLADRAAQFSPFAALTGHGDAIKETARLTDKRIELDDDEKIRLSEKLLMIANQLDDQPEVSITYFLADGRKAGGAYVAVTGVVKKIDEYERMIIMRNGVIIPVDDVAAIDGDMFDTIEEC